MPRANGSFQKVLPMMVFRRAQRIMHAGLPPLCTVSWRSCIFLCTHDAQAKTLDPYDCKKFIVGKEVDNLLKTVSEKAQYMYDTALQNYKNFQVRTTTCYDMRQPGAPGHNAHRPPRLRLSACYKYHPVGVFGCNWTGGKKEGASVVRKVCTFVRIDAWFEAYSTNTFIRWIVAGLRCLLRHLCCACLIACGLFVCLVGVCLFGWMDE